MMHSISKMIMNDFANEMDELKIDVNLLNDKKLKDPIDDET